MTTTGGVFYYYKPNEAIEALDLVDRYTGKPWNLRESVPVPLKVPSLWRECAGVLVSLALLGLLAWRLFGGSL